MMPSLSKTLHLKLTVRLAAIGTFLLFLAVPFRAGWTRAETDFPNYYTAAVLVRQHQPLHKFYDWTWFARQMNYAGNGTQLGAYTPQTPLTMLPMVGIAGFAPQTAKQIWLLCNLVFLGVTVWLLSRITRFRFEVIWLLTFLGYFSLRTNFLFGQYYIFLLLLLTLGLYLLDRKQGLLGAATIGIAFALKLYGGPFLLFFAIKRRWKALCAMAVTVLFLLAIAILLFGVADVRYYATQILPRSLEVGQVDPYSSGDPTFSTVLMRLFVAEPELNPHPIWEAPWLAFFLRSFISLAIVAFLLLRVSIKRTTDRHDFACFVIAALLLSTSTVSYTFIVLLLPLVLLLEEASRQQSIFLIASYVLLTLPLRPGWLFPKVWVLFALFIGVGWPYWRCISRRMVLAAVIIAAILSYYHAEERMMSYNDEPRQHFARVVTQPGALFSSFPVVSRAGLFYQSMGHGRYVLRWLHGGQNDELAFEGQALHPSLARDGTSINFELVANRTSAMMQFNPATGSSTSLAIPVLADSPASTVSPDGKWVAFESPQDGPMHIWLRDLSTGQEKRLTDGNCNSTSPAWEMNSKAIIFASDCERAFGLPALYRAQILDKHDELDRAATNRLK